MDEINKMNSEKGASQGADKIAEIGATQGADKVR